MKLMIGFNMIKEHKIKKINLKLKLKSDNYIIYKTPQIFRYKSKKLCAKSLF